jgi:hypothetical protein
LVLAALEDHLLIMAVMAGTLVLIHKHLKVVVMGLRPQVRHIGTAITVVLVAAAVLVSTRITLGVLVTTPQQVLHRGLVAVPDQVIMVVLEVVLARQAVQMEQDMVVMVSPIR